MKLSKREGVGGTLLVLAFVGYIAMHIYFAYVAFTTFTLWAALAMFLIPVFGDLFFIGACIGAGMWSPVIFAAIVLALAGAGESIKPKESDNG